MITEQLNEIQCTLSAPKNQKCSMGYNYRSCEDILEAVKPILLRTGCAITLSDDLVTMADEVFVCATATLTNMNGESISARAFAKHPGEQRGMSPSQITGSTSSYARKYAMNGLFCIDDNKDPDTDEYQKSEAKTTTSSSKVGQAPKPLPEAKVPAGTGKKEFKQF